MPPRTIALLILSSLLNAALCVAAFFFGLFATSPTMQDVTMRIGYYVVNVIVVAAFLAIFGPWVLALRKRNKSAVLMAALPAILIVLAVLSFLLLDSWLQRTFAGEASLGVALVAPK